jgi:hypothetical protein
VEGWSCGDNSKDLCKENGWPAPPSPKLGANLGRSDDLQPASGNQPDGSDLKRGQQQARDFAPRLSLKKGCKEQPGLASHSGHFRFSIADCRFVSYQ